MKHNSIVTLPVLLFLAGCANIAMPTGGPRDETPPELVSSNPSNNQRNFSGKTIELTFNEDIKLKDPKEEILIIPSIGKNTLFTVKKKKLVIQPELNWQRNTTYSINFREGVQDITEGNPADNLHIAFSTGPIIDSLSISGSIKDIFSEKIPTKITIAIYEADTFDIFKHSPTYFTKSDEEGFFTLSNLKSNIYFLYAFDDKNKNLKVDSKTEKFGFIGKPIELVTPQDSVEIAMTQVDARPLTLTNVRHTDKISRIRFNKQLDSLKVKGLLPSQSIYSYGTDKSELIFYNAFEKGDSIKTYLSATDSVGNKIDTVIYLKYGELKSPAETFKTKEISLQYNLPTKEVTYILSYNKPLGHLTYDSIYIRYDSITTKVLNNKDRKIDTLNNLLILKTIVDDIPLIEGKKKAKSPELILAKGALISIDQDSTKRIIKSLKIPTEEDLGMVNMKIETTEKIYIVQLLTSDNKVVRSVKNVKSYLFKNLEPLEYKIRIIVDSNNNGKWDTGNFYQKLEPEKIILYKSEEGKYSFPIRANWEYGPVLIKF